MGWALTIAGGVVLAAGLLLGVIAPTDRMTSGEAFFARVVIMVPTVLFGLVLIGLGHLSREIAALKTALRMSTLGSVLAAASQPSIVEPPAAAPPAGLAPALAAGAAGAAIGGAAVLAATAPAATPEQARPEPEPEPQPASVLDRFDLELERRLAASLEAPIDLTPEPVVAASAPPVELPPIPVPDPVPEPPIPDAFLPAEPPSPPEPVVLIAEAAPAPIVPEEPPAPVIPPLPSIAERPFAIPTLGPDRPRPPTVAEYVAGDEATMGESPVPTRQVVREGQFAGRRYRMFEDGSLEIDTDQSTLRFDSLDEFRAFVATGAKAPAAG